MVEEATAEADTITRFLMSGSLRQLGDSVPQKKVHVGHPQSFFRHQALEVGNGIGFDRIQTAHPQPGEHMGMSAFEGPQFDDGLPPEPHAPYFLELLVRPINPGVVEEPGLARRHPGAPR